MRILDLVDNRLKCAICREYGSTHVIYIEFRKSYRPQDLFAELRVGGYARRHTGSGQRFTDDCGSWR